jgi:hypothetical protein
MLFSLATGLGTLAKQLTRSLVAKNAVSMAQPEYDCDVYVNPLPHPTDCQSAVHTQLQVMSNRPYNPVRSAIILTISFLLPLILSFYSDRLTSVYASLWSPSANSAAANRFNNTTIQSDSALAQQQSVRSPSRTSISLTIRNTDAALGTCIPATTRPAKRRRKMEQQPPTVAIDELHESLSKIWRRTHKRARHLEKTIQETAS